MQKLLVPVLILAAVALSSSNVLPVLSLNELNAEPLGFDYQHNDNTFSNNHQTRNTLSAILFNVDVEPEIDKRRQENVLGNNEDFNTINKDANYNVKGFRKDQWHNYPRQLDRLNQYFYEHSTDKRNLDPDDPGIIYADESNDRLERSLDDIDDPETRQPNNEAEIAAAVINPLLIFRIQLAYYNKDVADNQPQLEVIDLDNDILREEHSHSNEVNPESNQKVKREGKINLEDVGIVQKPSTNLTVNKRIFSLWSRLQSLNPKGHQLHHRRHLYAMYGLPDSDGGGGGVLTAETRATFMRPPGSPTAMGLV